MARAKRDVLLRVHGYRLRPEDLEDCYSQATLELIAAARRGERFANRTHLARTLEQRFLSRVNDRRRALCGRSPMEAAIEDGSPLDVGLDVPALADRSADPEKVVLMRQELLRIQAAAARLTPEQRLVIATQVALKMRAREFCALHGWSPEKYRKVAQRGRARLRRLVDEAVPVARERSEQAVGTGL